MTTPIVPSITDEQLAELEEYCEKKAFVCCGNLSVGGEYMGAQEMVCCGDPELTEVDINTPAEEILGLIARLRAAEKNAARYLWLRDRVGVDFVYGEFHAYLPGGNYVRNKQDKEETDHMIDAAMEQSK